MDDGRLTTIDEAAIKAEIRSMSTEIARYMADCRTVAEKVEPHYRKMYQMSLERDVGMSRWVDFGLRDDASLAEVRD